MFQSVTFYGPGIVPRHEYECFGGWQKMSCIYVTPLDPHLVYIESRIFGNEMALDACTMCFQAWYFFGLPFGRWRELYIR